MPILKDSGRYFSSRGIGLFLFLSLNGSFFLVFYLFMVHPVVVVICIFGIISSSKEIGGLTTNILLLVAFAFVFTLFSSLFRTDEKFLIVLERGSFVTGTYASLFSEPDYRTKLLFLREIKKLVLIEARLVREESCRA